MKVCFETFGCRLNKAEAIQMEADYLASGWELAEKHADADLFVIRGCSVTARAQHDCEKLIDHLKRHYPMVPIKVCGCLKPPVSVLRRPDIPPPEAPTTPVRTARAYLKVQDGCAGQCTFCIVPKFRGTSKSEPFDALLDRARRFIDTGYREIVVTGCNLALFASQGKRLADLVAALADLDPACRVRIGSLEPGPCALETIHSMSEHANVCRFLHLPVQSGSERILLAMRRPYTTKDVVRAAELATELMPGLGLGCDIITGFPGETDLEFAATRGILNRLPFNNAHIFPYSSRPGTLAAGFPLQVPRPIRAARAHELSRIMKQKRIKFAQSFVGKTVEIVVEDAERSSGWTGEYLSARPVSGTAPRKSSLRLFITKSKDDRLYGRITT